MSRCLSLGANMMGVFALLGAVQLDAVVVPDRTGVAEREFRHPDLDISAGLELPAELPALAGSRAAAELAALGVPADRGRLDVRGNRWGVITPSQPLVPGRGVGNELRWDREAPASAAAFGQRAADALLSYLQAGAAQLRIDVDELARPGHVNVLRDGELVQVHIPRVVDGLPVRDSYVTAALVQGNLVLFGAHQWGDIDVATVAKIAPEEGLAAVQSHVEPFTIEAAWGKTELVLVPMAAGRDVGQMPIGRGYDHRLAWVLRPSFADDLGRYEALVDAHSGELISFEDTNQYATTRQVKGGVFPETNDGGGPEGTEQAGWPMPFCDVTNAGNTYTTDEGGNLLQCLDGTITSQLRGPYMLMNDSCGAISLSGAGDLDFGTSGGTDCTTPGFGGAGNTHSSRSGFYEMNRIKEMARGQLPANSWLPQQLQANMNLNNTCNAFWDGITVNFYRFGGGCNNTGELAGVFDHEWGHGMDAYDATPGISNPGEGIPDVYAALRLGTSCIGRGFRLGNNCGGYGDPCTQCDGVRDIDFAKRASGVPHTFTWANATCGGTSHCRGYVYSEAVWDLWKRDLPAAPYNMDNNTALEVVTRLTYLGAGGVGTWYSGSPPFGGCAATGGYMQYLTADDDNGNLADGTPHMTAIFAAFNRHQIACATPTVQDSGCVGTPTTAPSVTGTARDRGTRLSWGAIAGATEYEIFRTDGVFACDFGKTKVGTTTGTAFSDSGLQNGRDYYYTVIAKGASDSCFGPASACATVTPVAGANLSGLVESASFSTTSGDGDEFLDNCEMADVTLPVANIGSSTLTNVQIVGASSASHPSIAFLDSFPITVSASLPTCANADATIQIVANGLASNDVVEIELEIAVDQFGGENRTFTVSFDSTEGDFQTFASRQFDFEADAENWQTIAGTFQRDTAGGGAGGSAAYLESSSFLDLQCDVVRSPRMKLAASSTMQFSTNMDIEQFDTQWWDRANVGVYDPATGARTLVNPSSGRTYNASGIGGTCGTENQAGWAGRTFNSWATSDWNSTALQAAIFAGIPTQIQVNYGTDPLVNGYGIRFDRVTVTDADWQVADAQPDVCTDTMPFIDGFETGNTSRWSVTVP